MKLRIGYESARISQEFQTLSTVVSLAFGGKDNEPIKPAETAEEAISQFNSIFKK